MFIEAQRGAFLILVFGILFLFRRFKHLLVLFFLSIIIIYLFIDNYGSFLSYRFENGASDFFEFFKSFFNLSFDPRYSSTESRLGMFRYVIENYTNDGIIFFQGLPIDQIIVPKAWRNPHNGYLSAFSRGGIFIFLFYFLFLIDSLHAIYFSRQANLFSITHFVYFSCCIDAFTQTTFDSPYSLFLLIFSSSLSIAIRIRFKYEAIQKL